MFARLFFNKRPSKLNPRYCTACDDFVSNTPGGTELEISMLFADVRGSTTIAEKITPSAFSNLMNRFYTAATDVMVRTDAFIDKLAGDGVIGLYVSGFAGPGHARVAVDAAVELLRATGHKTKGGPWLPVGAGVHTGVAFVGSVGSPGGISQFTALGDSMNITARLASLARAGEILVSSETCAAAKLDTAQLEERRLELKGRSEPVSAFVLTA
ncbi:MAG: adenylate/guanylate cyclase domain-containing protein [Bacteroidota bacterium]